MQVPFHPIIVHFPVALLFLYSVCELIRLRVINRESYWFYLKAILVIVGTATTSLALETGETAAELLTEPNALVRIHSNFAEATFWIFTILSIAYAVAWINQLFPSFFRDRLSFVGRVVLHLSSFVLSGPIVVTLSLFGLLFVTVTGGLGGAIVYGTNFDPFMKPIFTYLEIFMRLKFPVKLFKPEQS